MNDVKNIINVYSRILKIYKQIDIIDKVQYKYELNEDGSLKKFNLYVVTKNTDMLIKLFLCGDDGETKTYEGLFENTLSSYRWMMSQGYLWVLDIMVEGSGNTLFDPTVGMMDMEV